MDEPRTGPAVEVSRSALLANVGALRARLEPGTRFAAVLKANAWGHGRDLVAGLLRGHVDLLAAAEPADALALARYAPGRTLCLGPSYGEQLHQLCRAGVAVCVSHPSAVAGLPRGADVHVLVDTGLHRLGVRPSDAAGLIAAVRARAARVEGLFCHVAGADRGAWPQVEAEVATLRRCGAARYRHVGGSSVVIERPDLVGNLARPGLALYGHHPAPRQRQLVALSPALRLTAPIVELRELRAGETVGYGGLRLDEPTVVATLAIGVTHGLDPRMAQAGCPAVVLGRPCRLLGPPMLDYTLVDVGAVPGVAMGDPARLLGGPTGDPTAVESVAARLGCSAEHVLTRLSAQLARRAVA